MLHASWTRHRASRSACPRQSENHFLALCHDFAYGRSIRCSRETGGLAAGEELTESIRSVFWDVLFRKLLCELFTQKASGLEPGGTLHRQEKGTFDADQGGRVV